MKILPDYLTEMMPALEEALEELRMSVIDHAYELLKCLDVDELSSDTIRKKLELYDLKIDNMTEEWLPNGKFYRMYPSIKHNRTRLNSLRSVVCSGGQFEGLWSNEFIKEPIHNYNKIRTLRHYTVESEYDGYFYVSGNVGRTTTADSDSVENSVIVAMDSDILLNQAMPAGYTYLYVPWPRPTYPADSGYFYNINMLNVDRLHYATNCNYSWYHIDYIDGTHVDLYYNGNNHGNNRYYSKVDNLYGPNWWDVHYSFDDSIEGDIKYYDIYSTDIPASTTYNWDIGDNTPWHTPYWLDYHYMDDMRHEEPSNNFAGRWPIVEHGRYIIYDEDGHAIDVPVEDAKFYILDEECEQLGDSNSIFPTPCYIRSSNRTSEPNQSQEFTPKSFQDGEDPSELTEEIFTIDETNLDDITKQNIHKDDVDLFGPYRWEHLFDRGMQIIQEMHHIKTYKPIWSECSPVFAMMQSNYNSGLHPENISPHSFYNWFKLKQDNNITHPEESTIIDNDPSISEITHTSYDRPTYGYIAGKSILAYTRSSSDSQGENNSIDTAYAYNNPIYYFSENSGVKIDPNKTYEILSITANSGLDIVTYDSTDYNNFPILGMDISNDRLCIDANGLYDIYEAAYILFREKETIETHKFWFEFDHTDTLLQSDDLYIYHEDIENWRLEYSYSNYKSIAVEILGIYNSNNEPVAYTNNASIELVDYYGSSYAWLASKFGITEQGVCANLIYDLNGAWEQLTWTNVNDGDESHGTTESTILSEVDSTHRVFRSFSNHNVHSSEASMFINVTAIADCELTFKINNDSESTGDPPYSPWDYTEVFLDGDLVSNYQLETTWVDCIIQITAGSHIITVTYRKDGSASAGNDRGYIAVPNSLIDIGTMSGECYGEVFSPVTAAYAICKLKKVNTPAREVQ